MEVTSSLERLSNEYDPAVDTLVALKAFPLGNSRIEVGDVIPVKEIKGIPPQRLAQMIRVRFAKVIFGARQVPVARKKAEPKAVAAPAKKAEPEADPVKSKVRGRKKASKKA